MAYIQIYTSDGHWNFHFTTGSKSCKIYRELALENKKKKQKQTNKKKKKKKKIKIKKKIK